MKNLYFLCLLILSVISAKAQIIPDSTSMQALYTNQVFYSLDNGEISNVDNNNWEIALSVSGNGAAGSAILLNEATATLWAYPGDTSNWNNFDTTNYKNWKRLLNTDTSWTNGAFNLYRGAGGTFDMGWGFLNPNNNYWTFGDSLYLIKLSDNTFRKLWIVSLKSGTWEFKFANLDGSNPSTATCAKSTYPNKNFVYYSFITNQFIDREPNNTLWDLTFVKHTDYVSPPGAYTSVSSVFTNKKVQTAKARVSSYANALSVANPQTTFTKRIDNIGREWKKFSSATGWTVYDSIAYFVYDNDSSDFYRLVFTKFSGSSNGKTYFVKQKLDVSSINENDLNIALALYPNPATTSLTILYSNLNASDLKIEIIDINGKNIKSILINSSSEVQQLFFDVSDLSNGVYFVQIKSSKGIVSQKFIKTAN